MYRPENMRTIPLLTDNERIKYEQGLTNLWQQLGTAPKGSDQAADAQRKIRDFGKMLYTKIQQRRNGPQSQPPPPQQPPQQQQNPVSAGQAFMAQQSQQPPSNAPQAPPTMSANNANANASAVPPTPSTMSAPNQPAAASPAAILQSMLSKVSQTMQDHINGLNIQAPPTEADKEKYVTEKKIMYTKALMQMETVKRSKEQLEQSLKIRKAKGETIPPDEEKVNREKMQLFLQKYQEAQRFISSVRQQTVDETRVPPSNGAQKPAENGTPAPAAPVQGGNQVRPPAPGARPLGASAPVPGASGPMQHSTATVNAAIEHAKAQQRMAGHLGQVPTTAAQVQSPAVAQAPPAQVAAPQQRPGGLQQAQIKMEPGTQPQNANIPAPLNTAITAGLTPAHQQGSGTPTQNSAGVQTPQSAAQQQQAIANARPLNHAAAISKAANNLAGQQHSSAIPGQPGSAPPSTPTAMSAQQGHPHAHPAAPQPQPSQISAIQSKLPIPKALHEKATQLPAPATMMSGGVGGGRPTYSGGSGIAGGVMGQPVLAKAPIYKLEAKDERVLNKNRLDELVRQVCGGIAEGQEGNLLTPEVEESVLNLADHFVDNVLQSACRNAKERGSKVLEIRDLQLVLERGYNIRIPGYSSEELRTVRKVQPSAQWITKMSAVQAAKVMPGKGDL